MAGPLRFRRSFERWNEERVRRALLGPLEKRFGARLAGPWFRAPPGYAARRLEMDNGDLALFAWTEADDSGENEESPQAFWMGNTETPEILWRTEKYGFGEVPYPVARWAQRELLAVLEVEAPWLAAHEHLAWFFLPVLCSKDGRDTTRTFFDEHAAGFPDADREDALGFYEDALSTGMLDGFRETMAGKLGTSEHTDVTRMGATMSEFTAAKLLYEAGYAFAPEAELDSGYALDFRVLGRRSRAGPACTANADGADDAGGDDADDGAGTLVEVTRPGPPMGRAANTPIAAVRETVDTKTDGQLDAHAGAVLFVDCTSFRDDEWVTVRDEQPGVGYRPAVVFRARPEGETEGYTKGSVPLDFDGAIRRL